MKLVDLRLVALARRRAASTGILVVTVLLAATLALNDWAPAAYLADAFDADLGEGANATLERARTRQGIWAVLMLWLLPVFLLHAARTVDGWKRRGEVDWLGAKPVTRATVAFSTWLGQLTALVLLGLGTLALAEGVVQEAPPTLREAEVVGAPESPWFDGRRLTRWMIPHAAPNSVFTFEASVTHGGPGMRVIVVNPDDAHADSSRIVGRQEVEFSLAGGASETGLMIAANGYAFGTSHGPKESEVPDVTGYLHPDSGRLWTPCASERRANLNLLLRLGLVGAVWIALGLGLGAWMRGSLAALSIGATWTAASMWAGAPAWLPGARLVHSLGVVGRGRVPAEIGPETVLGTLALVAFGVSLAVTGLRDWRRET
jgi:hypothetical protein